MTVRPALSPSGPVATRSLPTAEFQAALAEASSLAQQQGGSPNPHPHVQGSPVDVAPGPTPNAVPLPLPHLLTDRTAYNRVNLPWFNFGADFGSNAWGHQGISVNPQVADTLTQFCNQGVDDVITWTIPDGRNLQFAPDGTPSALSPGFAEDLTTYLDLLSARGMSAELVLIDGNTWFPPAATAQGVTFQGHGDVIADPTGQKQAAFDSNILSPMLATVKAWETAHPGAPLPVSGISVGSELYYGVNRDSQDAGKNVSMTQMQAFVRGRVETIHQQLPGVPVTIGAARAEDLFDNWIDSQLGGSTSQHLDYYTFHDYEPQSLGDMARAYPWGQLGKSVHLGEYPGTAQATGPNPPGDFLNAVTGSRGAATRPAGPGRFVSSAAVWAGRHVDNITSPNPTAELSSIQDWYANNFVS